MAGKIKVPEPLVATFNRVLQRVPTNRRDDIKLQKNILLFLKLGGERLARARLKPVVSPFPDDISVIKPRPLPIIEESGDVDDESEKPESTKADDPAEEQD